MNELTLVDKLLIPKIKLWWADGHSEVYDVLSNIRGVSHKGKRPVDLEWYNVEGVLPTREHLEWINSELVHVFDPSINFNNRIANAIQK